MPGLHLVTLSLCLLSGCHCPHARLCPGTHGGKAQPWPGLQICQEDWIHMGAAAPETRRGREGQGGHLGGAAKAEEG